MDISATRRSATAFDRRHWFGGLWPRWSWTAEKLNWNARYRAWLAERPHIPIFLSRREMFKHLCPENSPITYLEFGVAQGDSLRQWLSLNRHEESRFHGFDAWQGMPKVEGSPFKEGEFLSDPPVIGDARCTLHKGWIGATLPDAKVKLLLGDEIIINIDTDNYGPASYILHTLNPGPGTTVLFDQVSVAECEFRALMDWLEASGRREPRTAQLLAGWRHGKRVEGVAVRITS